MKKTIWARNKLEARRLLLELHRKGPRDKGQGDIEILNITKIRRGQYAMEYKMVGWNIGGRYE